MSSRHYVRLPYCSLCGQRFDKILAFHSVISHDGPDSDLAVTRSIVFQYDGITYLEDYDIQIHDYPRKKARYAPSVHSLCHTVGMNLVSPRAIYDLGFAMMPLVCAGLLREIYRYNPLAEAVNSLPETSRLGQDEIILWTLLDRCRRLPYELSTIIWDFLAPGPIRCLLALNAARKTWLYTPRSAGAATIYLYGGIVVFFTYLLKEKYICGIRQGCTICGHESDSFENIRVPASSAACVFSLGIFGLQNIEFLAEAKVDFAIKTDLVRDGKKFVRVISCQQGVPVCVNVEWDVLKISLISSHDKSAFGNNFVWVSPLPCELLRWLSPKRFYDWPRHFDFANQPQRVMAYVPLRNNEILYGLTAFCSNFGFVGLGTHFRSRLHSTSCGQNSSVYWYGEQHGCPIHIQLGDSETIRSIYIYQFRISELSFSYLTIQTTKNRLLILGPRFPGWQKTVASDITYSEDREVLGLYYDASPGITNFTSMGTLCRPSNSSVSQKLDISITQLLASFDMACPLISSPFTMFLSEALLKNIETIKLCYANSRCTGMLLYYNNGGRCVLGQWYENTHVQTDIQTISLQRNGFLWFYFTGADCKQLVIHVKALTGAGFNEPDVMFTDIVYGDKIVWAFSGDTDIISGVSS